ncbi:MAG: hypothetical protein A2017_03725 [Lentisphaerae bacterium GWF2_44_16]|nr:MAG: hypothetical protein A2017_03725 [Lentisphaerae bacterium GWF2_44_16]
MKISDRLASGKDTVRIVCFGDSITGIYYHTGGRRAYCDMLGIALKRIYPNAKIKMLNAGVSGNDTAKGWARIERDVLSRKPDLVVIMFGMNDCRTDITQGPFISNLKKIVHRCREIGAEIVLCTPNSVYPIEKGRTVENLAACAEIIRNVAKDLSVPLADCYRAFENIHAANDMEWKLLMSERIHPNMNGHKLFAEVIAETISGKRVVLKELPPHSPSLSFTFDLLSDKRPINVIAMPPYDRIIPEVLLKLYPDAVINMTTWPVAGTSLSDIVKWAKNIRAMKPNLVTIAIPAEFNLSTESSYNYSYEWILNWSLNRDTQTWDTFAILPSVIEIHIKTNDLPRANLARRVILGKDIGFVERKAGDNSPPKEIIFRWIQAQHKVWSDSRQMK